MGVAEATARRGDATRGRAVAASRGKREQISRSHLDVIRVQRGEVLWRGTASRRSAGVSDDACRTAAAKRRAPTAADASI
jgi:hypothetical protein